MESQGYATYDDGSFVVDWRSVGDFFEQEGQEEFRAGSDVSKRSDALTGVVNATGSRVWSSFTTFLKHSIVMTGWGMSAHEQDLMISTKVTDNQPPSLARFPL